MPSKIEWTGESWNPIRVRLRSDPGVIGWHCEHASPGCQNCYAETQNVAQRFDLGTGLPYKPGHRRDVEIYIDEAALVKPLRWKKGRKVFVCSMTDLFADFVTDEMIDRIFAVMALCPQHTFQVLTKRAGRMRQYLEAWSGDWSRTDAVWNEVHRLTEAGKGDPGDREIALPLPNVWLGVSVEDQQRADERIPDLLATPAAVRWISAEPLLGPVDLCDISAAMPTGVEQWNALDRIEARQARDEGGCDGVIDWVVVGGESGKGARPMHPDWARSLRDQCAAAGVPFFFKQWGEMVPAELIADDGSGTPWRSVQNYTAPVWIISEYGKAREDLEQVTYFKVGKKRAGRLLDGVLHDGMPEQ